MMYINDIPNMEVLRIVFTPGIPSSDEVRGYDIWSSISFGDRPIHSVATICWLSPISGIASTGTGFLGRKPIFQLNGAEIVPHPIKTSNINIVITRFSKKYLISFLSILKSSGIINNIINKVTGSFERDFPLLPAAL